TGRHSHQFGNEIEARDGGEGLSRGPGCVVMRCSESCAALQHRCAAAKGQHWNGQCTPCRRCLMAFTLEGKTALVSGAGRGIGRAIATKLKACGASVMINDLDESAVRETKCQLDCGGERVDYLAGDLTDPSFPEKLVKATIEKFGSVDIIVNNAGYSWDNVIQKTTDEQFQAMLDIHLVVPFRLLRAASGFIRDAAKKEAAAGVRIMRKVVNITSIAGTEGNAGQAGYSSGKAGVLGLTRTMAKE